MYEKNIYTTYGFILLVLLILVVVGLGLNNLINDCEQKGGTFLTKDAVCISNQYIIK